MMTITLNIVWENDFVGHWQKKYKLLEVIGYGNSNYARDVENEKSITEYCFFF